MGWIPEKEIGPTREQVTTMAEKVITMSTRLKNEKLITDDEDRMYFNEAQDVLRRVETEGLDLFAAVGELEGKFSSLKELEKIRRRVPLPPPPRAPAVPRPRAPAWGIPPGAAPFPTVMALPPRDRRTEAVMCFVRKCPNMVTVDRDLVARVATVAVMKASYPRGIRVEPLLMFPRQFYYTCEEHRLARYGYRDAYDAIAYMLVNSQYFTRMMITEGTLKEIGLDDEDIREINVRLPRWQPTAPEGAGLGAPPPPGP